MEVGPLFDKSVRSYSDISVGTLLMYEMPAYYRVFLGTDFAGRSWGLFCSHGELYVGRLDETCGVYTVVQDVV